MSTKDLIHEAEALPIEERVKVVDSLLSSLNPVEPEIERRWASVAQKRLREIRAGSVQAVPGEEVFEKIRKEIEVMRS